jgi:hypothetical protein
LSSAVRSRHRRFGLPGAEQVPVAEGAVASGKLVQPGPLATQLLVAEVARRRHGLRSICRVVAAGDDVAVLAIACGVEGGGRLRLAGQPLGPQQYGGTADVGGVQRRRRVPS